MVACCLIYLWPYSSVSVLLISGIFNASLELSCKWYCHKWQWFHYLIKTKSNSRCTQVSAFLSCLSVCCYYASWVSDQEARSRELKVPMAEKWKSQDSDPPTLGSCSIMLAPKHNVVLPRALEGWGRAGKELRPHWSSFLILYWPRLFVVTFITQRLS